jgi:hypothetical protein
MLMILAAIVFAVGFVLQLAGVDTGRVSLLFLGLFLMALAGASPIGFTLQRRPPSA